MLYIIMNGDKQYLSGELVEKYQLKAGMHTSFTGCKILEDANNEENKEPAGE